MSDTTRESCQQAWDAHRETQARLADEQAWWDALRPALAALHGRGIRLIDEQGRTVEPNPSDDSRAGIRLAFALKAHLLDEGTGWSPP